MRKEQQVRLAMRSAWKRTSLSNIVIDVCQTCIWVPIFLGAFLMSERLSVDAFLQELMLCCWAIGLVGSSLWTLYAGLTHKPRASVIPVLILFSSVLAFTSMWPFTDVLMRS
jgi:hypothetical protein